MGLKQDIVIVNEFTVKLPDRRSRGGNKGSRGGTPGDYVTRYMARELATESLAPIRRDNTEDFITRYMAREKASERLDASDRSEIKEEMRRAQGDGGVAFGYGSVSLSDHELRKSAKDIQRLFDEGHTVMKTVLSFKTDYLKKHGVLPSDFVLGRKGDFRGQVDQMKLRLAFMHALERMGKVLYDDLRYVGVIQVDTEHVHCHLAMVDAGDGRRARDGTQVGKIGMRAKSILRRGVDSWLDENQHMAHLSSAVGYERRNVVTYVKKWSHQMMLREALPQLLLATLPEDRRLWRLGTNNPAMRKPNRIVRQMVRELLDRPDSGMTQAMASVQEYANRRRAEEGLTQEQWRRLVERGEEQIVERGVNAVYSLLRQLPSDVLRVRTPMLDVMGMDYDDLAARAHEGDASVEADDDIVSFGFRLRSYSSRMQYHVSERERNRDMVRWWDDALRDGQALEPSRPLRNFYEEEEEYHARCSAKYRKFLPVVETSAEAAWRTEWARVQEYGERLISLESMRRDSSLRRTSDPKEAERIGFEVYGQRGGALVSKGDRASVARLEKRSRSMREEYARKIEDLRASMAGQGLLLRTRQDPQTGMFEATAEPGAEYDFEEVKGLDLHHMGFDFSSDAEVGPHVFAQFREAAESRRARLLSAIGYLESTDQEDAIDALPVSDVAAMMDTVEQIEDSKEKHGGKLMLTSRVAELARAQNTPQRSRTVELTAGLSRRIEESLALISFDVQETDLQAPETDGLE